MPREPITDWIQTHSNVRFYNQLISHWISEHRCSQLTETSDSAVAMQWQFNQQYAWISLVIGVCAMRNWDRRITINTCRGYNPVMPDKRGVKKARPDGGRVVTLGTSCLWTLRRLEDKSEDMQRETGISRIALTGQDDQYRWIISEEHENDHLGNPGKELTNITRFRCLVLLDVRKKSTLQLYKRVTFWTLVFMPTERPTFLINQKLGFP